ncbi:MAG TPA: AbrB/MazE/SpoVT family DNA-binding domain-containing protein [Verrucomicrobiae bacterium]|nr:AbrB/MazE/SpoVT family DNA-binding domain-containing protein [Verrucomicrobiae bacterium]
MSLVTVKNKYQIVIPQSVRNQIGVNIGDLLDVTARKGTIVLKPKVLVDRDDYTPAQRRHIDAQLAASLAEKREGKARVFATHREMVNFLDGEAKKSSPRRVRSGKRRSR